MIPSLQIKLPTLADEIAARLPELICDAPTGVTLKSLTSTIGADIAHIRRAATELNVSARAWLMRRRTSRELFLVPNSVRVGGLRICASCGTPFEAPFYVTPSGRTKFYPRRCCSRKCGIAWSWTRPGVRDCRKAGIREERRSPEAKARLAAHNKRRWAKPGERERLAEQNRREWADPVKGALRAQSIKAINGSPEMRKLYSDLRKEWWRDPVMREKMVTAVRAAHGTPEARAKFSALLRARWKDPVWREKWTRANRRKADNRRGTKQSLEQIQKRVAATLRAKAAKRQDAALTPAN